MIVASMSWALLTQPVGSETSRTIRFASGKTTIDADGNSDHVVVTDTLGKIVSESWCSSGDFDLYLGIFTKLRDSLARDDRSSVTQLVSYPLRINAKKPLVFKNQAALLRDFGKAFTPQVLERIHAAEPAAVFCHNYDAMIGDGVVWATVSHGSAKLMVINP